MSIYTHINYNKKTPTSQEKCGHVIKKVPKGLNCYQRRVTAYGVTSSYVIKYSSNLEASTPHPIPLPSGARGNVVMVYKFLLRPP